jgi:hypothetical protein
MAITMYQASVPVFTRNLGNLRAILEKASAHAVAKKIDPVVLTGARLYPDMLPLTVQVQIASDFARGTAARLAGKEPPSFEDKETTFAELVSRIDRTLDYLKTVKAPEIDGSETREVVRKVGGKEKKFSGLNYLLQFALPNFYFHVATAYAILRHSGVEIGKSDFIGDLD